MICFPSKVKQYFLFMGLLAFLSQNGHHWYGEKGSHGWFANWGRNWYDHWPDMTRDLSGNEMPSIRSEWIKKAMEEFQVDMVDFIIGKRHREDRSNLYDTNSFAFLLIFFKVGNKHGICTTCITETQIIDLDL